MDNISKLFCSVANTLQCYQCLSCKNENVLGKVVECDAKQGFDLCETYFKCELLVAF